MTNEFIELPIELKDWKVLFDSENQTIHLQQKNPSKIDLTELNPELCLLGVSSVEACPSVILEVSLIKDMATWLNGEI